MEHQRTKTKPAKSLRLWSLTIGTLSLLSTASAETFQLQLSSPTAGLAWSGTPGKFSGGPVSLKVNTDLRSWRLVALLSPANGPDGAIPTSSFLMTGAPAGGVSGISYFLSGSSNLSAQREIARGAIVAGAPTIGALSFGATVPALTHPGAAAANLSFFYQRTDVANQPFVPVGSLNLGFNVEGFVTATVGETPFGFTVNKFGSLLTASSLSVVVSTNIASGAQIAVSLGAVRSANAAIPANRLAIAFGASGSATNNNPNGVPLGTATLSPFYLSTPYGTFTYYARGRMLSTFEDKPGTYTGTLTFTVTSA